MNKLINRKNYIQQLEKLKDVHIIKIVTGLRRSGKSTLLNILPSKLLILEFLKIEFISTILKSQFSPKNTLGVKFTMKFYQKQTSTI